ncbi:metal ABC transporter substrate-binding protein [Natrinema halophilum]|uniref:Zinc ABC transporter substrate-binding protein n=1 Tax=Natrinema halophilum TaxID=1699371 RepID=A0A7D5GL50_9EURY|nr:zinc ABC transporter substrate-binding protein [Natrinema halophilum]QLG47493.1 zinc ABC transporter substrate-binding protein [Natrinema halophilum]
MTLSRRALVTRGAGAIAAGAFAGCLDDVRVSQTEIDAGYAAFFTLWDWAQQIGGNEIDFENPVGTGQAGHGWSPGGDLTREIADTGVFVYFDTPEFSWAQDIAATLEADYDTVAVIDGLAGLDDQLLDWDHQVDASGHDHGSEDTDNDDENDTDSHDPEAENGSNDHDESSIDPHVWLDPVLAREIVETISAGLADADPDNAQTYRDNASAFATDLEKLDEQFEALIETADRTVAVFAGHDSFTYLQERYGFELHTPIGVSPQSEPSQGDISATIDLIESEGIETILYSPFEDRDGQYPTLVNTILRDTDATDAMPITHLSGTLAKWQQKDWGYVDQMQEINVPAFREALDAQ